MFWRIYFAFAALVALFGAGAAMFYYAREHDPTPEADPMAVHLLSHGAYARLHYGGLAVMALGLLDLIWIIVVLLRKPSRPA